MSRTVTVLHSRYGCESGCCGHVVEVDGEQAGRFAFDHPPYDATEPELIAWAKEFVTETLDAEHAADLDWSQCLVSSD